MSGYPPPYPAGDSYYGGAPPPYTPMPAYPSAPPTQDYGQPQQQQTFAQHQEGFSSGGQQKSSGGHSVAGVGNFLKDNIMQVGSAAVSYKMGGGLGKMFAAGMTADLANKYSKQHKQYNQPESPSSKHQANHYPSSSGSGKGLTGDLMHTGKSVLGKAEKLVGTTMNQIKQTTQSHKSTHFQTGARVQLVNSKTGATVQIVQSSDGRLVVDAKGALGSQVYNAIWTVYRAADGALAFSNNGNYLSVVHRSIDLLSLGLTACPPINCMFHMEDHHGQVVLIPVIDHTSVLDTDFQGNLSTSTQRSSTFKIVLQ